MKANRYPVTVRFNREDQINLAALCEFWKCDEKQAMKLAFSQLVTATRELQKKLQGEQEKTATEATAPAEPQLEATTPEAQAG